MVLTAGRQAVDLRGAGLETLLSRSSIRLELGACSRRSLGKTQRLPPGLPSMGAHSPEKLSCHSGFDLLLTSCSLDLGEFAWVATRIVLPEVQEWADALLEDRKALWEEAKGKKADAVPEISEELKEQQNEYYGGKPNGAAGTQQDVVNGA